MPVDIQPCNLRYRLLVSKDTSHHQLLCLNFGGVKGELEHDTPYCIILSVRPLLAIVLSVLPFPLLMPIGFLGRKRSSLRSQRRPRFPSGLLGPRGIL